MNTGIRSFQQRRYGDALAAFEQATNILPGRVEGWINLGAALLETGRFEAAASALKRAVSIGSHLMVPHMLLGDALRQLGRREPSLTAYRKAVEIERTPMGLNKLACAMRTNRQVTEAGSLYLQALQMDPHFTLAKVNLATLQLEMQRFESARDQLNELAKLKLPPAERDEVENSLLAVTEYFRLQEPLTALSAHNDSAPLQAALADLPAALERVDEPALSSIRRYVETTGGFDTRSVKQLIDLPAEWSFIEAMFMVPMVETFDEYVEFKTGHHEREGATGDLLESFNMVDVIEATRKARNDLGDPVKTELHLRHWHAIASRDFEKLMPGHFKYTQNQTAITPNFKRVEPALASSTFRCFVNEIYRELDPGIVRAAMALMALCDMHPFADGNGRIAVSWMNRELEWAGLMPALFPRKLGFKGELGAATKIVRQGDSDLTPVLEVIVKAQDFAVTFCEQLAQN